MGSLTVLTVCVFAAARSKENDAGETSSRTRPQDWAEGGTVLNHEGIRAVGLFIESGDRSGFVTLF